MTINENGKFIINAAIDMIAISGLKGKGTRDFLEEAAIVGGGLLAYRCMAMAQVYGAMTILLKEGIRRGYETLDKFNFCTCPNCVGTSRDAYAVIEAEKNRQESGAPRPARVSVREEEPVPSTVAPVSGNSDPRLN